MGKNYYMHLLDGKPAYWDKVGKRLYFIPKFHDLTTSDILVRSLSTVRRHEVLYRNVGGWDLNYLRIPAGGDL